MIIDDFTIRAAAYRFEKERGIELGDPFDYWLSESGIEYIELDIITSELINFINKNLDFKNKLVSSAIFALGKKYDLNLKQYFIEIMSNSLTINMAVCYQAAIAVENLGEQIFKGTVSSQDYAANSIQIEKFLGVTKV